MAITLTILASADLGINPVVPATVTIDPQLPVVAATIEVGTTTTGAAGSDATVVNSGTAVNAVFDFTIPQGIQGTQGDAATIAVGTTTTLAAGSSATVSNSGTSGAAVFNFGIPQGIKGDTGNTGAAATIAAGSTTTGEPGSSASVTNSGTSSAAVFDFTIPRGDKGETGDTGAAATISVGTTSTLPPYSDATVENVGTSSAAVFNFGIPMGHQGPIGDPGLAATINVGVTTTGPAGTDATVENVGTSSAAIFNFTIPRGSQGDNGAPGVGVPTGGVAGDALLKVDGTDYNTAWGIPALATHSISSETVTATVRNNTGATLTEGQVVYINGALGNRPTVALAQADSEATSAGTYGMVSAPIADNTDGTIVIAGYVANLDTHDFSDGDKLYLSPTVAGGWTTTKPAAPDHMVYIGVVARAHPTQGVIQLRIATGYELEELHNVQIVSPTDNDLLAYDTATGLWKNKTAPVAGILTIENAALNYQPISAMSGYMQKINNLADLTDTSLARTNLGLGTAATLASSAVAQTANNLSDLASASTARTNLGLGTMATQTATSYLDKAGNLSGLASTSTARTNLGLGTIATFNDAPSDGSQYARQSGAWAVVTGGGGGGSSVNVQTFGGPSSSGTFTWTKPAGAKIVEVFLWSSGAGGGSGARQATTSVRVGGAGGAGGSSCVFKISADKLASTQTVVIGAGGAGGAAVTTNSTNGNPGADGNLTTFANFRANAPTAGAAGTTVSPSSGGIARTSFLYFTTGFSSNSGASGNSSAGSSGLTVNNNPFFGLGGGGGAGAPASSTISATGGTGAGVGIGTPSGANFAIAGGVAGTPVSRNGQDGVGYTASDYYFNGGTGGGGGAYVTGVTGGNGGNGGWPGGGGGGGSASDNGFNSGAGGNGANGYAVIITYL